MAWQLPYKETSAQATTGIRRGLTKVKEMNIFKRLFNWIQSAPSDFCYVTGEWGFQRKTIAKPALSGKVVQDARSQRALVVFPQAPAGRVAAARVAAFANFPLDDLLIQSVAAQEQKAYAHRAR